MEMPYVKYIGEIRLKSIRDFIIDNRLAETTAITLHQRNFDDIVLEYRDFYGESIEIPFIYLGVRIMEDETNKTPQDRIRVVYYEPLEPSESINLEEIIYRCGWCGNVVDFDGERLDPQIKSEKIALLEKYRNELTIKSTTGYCCIDKQYR